MRKINLGLLLTLYRMGREREYIDQDDLLDEVVTKENRHIIVKGVKGVKELKS